MFLLLFLLVNVSLIALRARRPDLDRGYRVPLFPWLTLLALHIVRVPQQLSLSDGRLLLKAGHTVMDAVIAIGQQANVPVHTMIRLGRDSAQAIRMTTIEQRCNLLLFGWPGTTSTAAQRFGSVIDPLVADPPSDIVVARLRQRELPQRILLPTAGGPHTALAMRVATVLAKSAPHGAGTVTLLYVARPSDGAAAAAGWWAQVAPLLEAIDAPIGTMVVHQLM
jgi:hypothetical protein